MESFTFLQENASSEKYIIFKKYKNRLEAILLVPFFNIILLQGMVYYLDHE